MIQTSYFDKKEYLECKIYKNNEESSQSLPYRCQIEDITKKLNSIQIEWDAYYNYNKPFRRFIKKNNLYNELKYKLDNEYSINCATNNWLNIYEILYRFQHIICTNSLSILFNTDLPGEIILATEYFFKKKGI